MQQDPLLATKLHSPPIRPELVSRPRLIERLNNGLDRKLTIISAPAGFGKTTLLSEWADYCQRPVAWLSLDAVDSTPLRFWTYVISALQIVDPSLGRVSQSALTSSPTPPIETTLTTLINDIATSERALVLGLDDYHSISNPDLHASVQFFIEHQPGNLHVAIATREDPPLPLSRLRARGQLTEIRAADLRFSEKRVPPS